MALPLKLVDFSVKKEGKTSLLKWEAADEVNTSHFEIERSSGHINFKKIVEVKALNSKEKLSYDFVDNRPDLENGGLFYYRLKMVDLDGKYSYSPIRSVVFENGNADFTAYPSPADKLITVDLQKTYNFVKAEIISSTGKELISKRFTNSKTFEIDVANLPKGMYFLRLNTGGELKGIKVLKE